jgi:hypothetical protein
MKTKSLQSLQQNQFFLQILIFSFATVLIWVAASVFLSQQRTGISPELQALARPLNPNIHLEVVAAIQQKRAFSDDELQGFPILKLIHNTNGTDSIIGGTANGTNETSIPGVIPQQPPVQNTVPLQTSTASAIPQ